MRKSSHMKFISGRVCELSHHWNKPGSTGEEDHLWLTVSEAQSTLSWLCTEASGWKSTGAKLLTAWWPGAEQSRGEGYQWETHPPQLCPGGPPPLSTSTMNIPWGQHCHKPIISAGSLHAVGLTTKMNSPISWLHPPVGKGRGWVLKYSLKHFL